MLINRYLDIPLLKSNFSSAQPFPFVVIDDFLAQDVVDEFYNKFPVEDRLSDKDLKSFDSGYGGEFKSQINPSVLSREMRDLFEQFNQQEFILFLEKVTGLSGLFGDPFFDGGGFHRTKKGGRLGIHADFRVNKRLKVIRRINVIIYLNKEWKDDWGGHLELWSTDKKRCVHSVAPVFNRCVIFQTDASSYHGHPAPLATPTDVSRDSLALYYYTGSDFCYLEESRKTTVYIDGDKTSFELKNRVRYRLINFALELLPPIISRRIFK